MTTDFRLYLLTWNVGEANPPKDLTRLLGLDGKTLPNLYAVGLQEMRSTTADFVFEDNWTSAVTDCLSTRNYVRIKTRRQNGIHISVYGRKVDLPYITNVESECTKAGLGGLWGNKGALSVRLNVFGVNVCIVAAHYAAHSENFRQRIEDYNLTLETQKFRDKDCETILDHDYVFWMGDLNFRIDGISNVEVRKRVKENDLEHLAKYDQLKKAIKEELIFIDFHEGPLTFAPTFKFDVGTDFYDTSVKNRVPSWCDRILWRVHEDSYEGVDLSVEQLTYASITDEKTSDHRPVLGEFTIQVLKSPSELPVMFEPIGCWCQQKDNDVSYLVSSNLTLHSRDWIGLYRDGYKNWLDYVTYVWASGKGEDMFDGSHMHSVLFEMRYLQRLQSDTYYLLYFSFAKNCVVGYSDAFRIVSTEESSSSETDDGEGIQLRMDTPHGSSSSNNARPRRTKKSLNRYASSSQRHDIAERSQQRVESVKERKEEKLEEFWGDARLGREEEERRAVPRVRGEPVLPEELLLRGKALLPKEELLGEEPSVYEKFLLRDEEFLLPKESLLIGEPLLPEEELLGEESEEEFLLPKEPLLKDEALLSGEKPFLGEKPLLPEEPLPREEPLLNSENALVREEPLLPEKPFLSDKPLLKESPSSTGEKSLFRDEPLLPKEPLLPEEPLLSSEKPVLSEKPLLPEKSLPREDSIVSSEKALLMGEPLLPEKPFLGDKPLSKEEPLLPETPVLREEPLLSSVETLLKEKPLLSENPLFPEEQLLREEPLLSGDKPLLREEQLLPEEPLLGESSLLGDEPLLSKKPLLPEESLLSEKLLPNEVPLLPEEPLAIEEPLLGEKALLQEEALLPKEPLLPDDPLLLLKEPLLSDEPLFRDVPLLRPDPLLGESPLLIEELLLGVAMGEDLLSSEQEQMLLGEPIQQPSLGCHGDEAALPPQLDKNELALLELERKLLEEHPVPEHCSEQSLLSKHQEQTLASTELRSESGARADHNEEVRTTLGEQLSHAVLGERVDEQSERNERVNKTEQREQLNVTVDGADEN